MAAIPSGDADDVGALRRVVRYVFYERNPIVQVLAALFESLLCAVVRVH